MGFKVARIKTHKGWKRKTNIFLCTTSKSQAALKFLTTYLWVLLVIVLTIGTLWYFGILSPSKILSDRCTIGPYINCKQYLIAETQDGKGVLRLKLENNFASTIQVESWELLGEDSKPLICAGEPFTGVWEDKQTIDVEFSGCNSKEAGLVLGEKGKVSIKMVYHAAQAAATYSKVVEGDLFAKVKSTSTLISESTAAFQCSVATSCEDNIKYSSAVVLKISNVKDAVAEIPSLFDYNYKVCCTSTSTKLSNSCASPDFIPLHLSSSTEAHVEKNTQSNFNVNVCLSTDPGTVSCEYKPSCLPSETCLATISADTDAHAGDCTTEPFSIRICCALSK